MVDAGRHLVRTPGYVAVRARLYKKGWVLTFDF